MPRMVVGMTGASGAAYGIRILEMLRSTRVETHLVTSQAADITIAEVDEIVEPGELDPEAIITPGLFVQRIVQRPPGFSPFQPIVKE